MNFASRTNWKLTPNQLTLKLKQAIKRGFSLINLTESNPTCCQFQYLKKALLAPLNDSKNLCYRPSPKGLAEARAAVSAYYRKKGISVHPEQIILTASTSEAYSLIFRLITNPGDRVLVPQPSYPLFSFLSDLNDITADHYPIRYDAKWQIDRSSLTQQCEPKTKAIILVHPNNPTGSFVKKGEFEKIIETAQKRSIAIISDEVFSDFAFSEDATKLKSCAECNDALTFTLGGISKSLGLPQMKLAWMIANGPKKVVREALARLEVISDTYLSTSTPIQNALGQWFKVKESIQKEILARLNKNLAFLRGETKLSAVDLLHAEGGWYAVLRLPRIKSEEEWVLEFLEKDRVMVHPGYFFDFENEAYIILSLLPPPEIFGEGVVRILNRVSKLS